MPRYISEVNHMIKSNEENIEDTRSTEEKHKEIDDYIVQKIEEYYEEFYFYHKTEEEQWSQVHQITRR